VSNISSPTETLHYAMLVVNIETAKWNQISTPHWCCSIKPHLQHIRT